MRILYRAEPWLRVGELMPAWARELADDQTSASEAERELWRYLRRDIINGLLDDAGPFTEGRRLGLGYIRGDVVTYVEGRQLEQD